MKKVFLCSFFLLLSICTANATSISDVGAERISGYRSSPPYGWTYRYDLSFQNQNLLMEMDIHLTGDDPTLIPGYDLGATTLRDQWEMGIESIWGDTFDIFDGTYLYDLVFDVNWVADTGTQHHNVDVISGTGHTNMAEWYTDSPAGWSNHLHDEIAAHEFGHMFGLYDEYAGGAVDPAVGLYPPGTIMDNLGVPVERHYVDLVSWLEGKSGGSFALVLDSGSHFYETISSVPEPGTILLLGIGLLGFTGLSRKI